MSKMQDDIEDIISNLPLDPSWAAEKIIDLFKSHLQAQAREHLADSLSWGTQNEILYQGREEARRAFNILSEGVSRVLTPPEGRIIDPSLRFYIQNDDVMFLTESFIEATRIMARV